MMESPTTITLERINSAIMGYLKDSIVPTVTDNGTAVKVPVIYGDGERWAQVRKEGYIRDPQSDKLLAPLIMLRRTNAKPGTLNNPNNKYQYAVQESGWNKRNIYDKFAMLNGIIPSRRFTQTIIPDYMDVEYEFIMWTETQQQMDTLIEQINVENYEFWGEKNNYKFRVNIDSFQGQSELPPADNRAIRTQFTLTVKAYLLPEKIVKNFKPASTTSTGYTYKKIVVRERVVNDIKNLEE